MSIDIVFEYRYARRMNRGRFVIRKIDPFSLKQASEIFVLHR